MASADDFYKVLGVARDASAPEIRRAYRRLARQHHPDRNPQPDGAERFRRLADAYAVLNDPAGRARYDHTLRPAKRLHTRADPPPARRGMLELSPREAWLAATTPITLTTASGITIVVPAGIGDGDRITVTLPDGRAVLTVRVNYTLKT
jgi:curved DNA-binding protein CbpA